MMTYEEQFEKQFPSLPRKDFMLFSDEEELLMKHCLDKQRVREAIDEILPVPSEYEGRQMGKTGLTLQRITIRIELMERLGL